MTWRPQDEVPSWMTDEQREAFWTEVQEVSIASAFRPGPDEWDEGIHPESFRAKVLAYRAAWARLPRWMRALAWLHAKVRR
jgi:hypothetical protein